MSKCRSCDAPIIWATTKNDKLMPVDAEASPVGNIELVTVARLDPRNNRVKAIVHAQRPFGSPELHMPHHATCPHADKWKS